MTRPQPRNVNHLAEGKFARFCPMDPPPAFKAGWKDIRLELGLGSTDVTLTMSTIGESLQTLGIAANSVKLHSISVWVMPGTAANASVPKVVLSVRDPVSKGSLGTREDTGQLSRAAKLKYQFASPLRSMPFDLPAQGTTGPTFAVIAASAANGSIQVSLSYSI